MYDLMIIGGGPAGLAAGVYAARKQLNTLLISGDIGGQINTTWGIENYLGYQFIEGPELISKFETQVGQFPIDQKIGDKVRQLKKIKGGFTAITEAGDKYQSQAVVFATGKRPRKLNVPGETELTGRGVSYCAICDGPVFAGQKVAVVGGGNSALEAVPDLLKIAEHVNLVSLTPRNETSVPGLFAAGDVTDVPEKQIIVAAGEGAKAALQAHRYLQRLAK